MTVPARNLDDIARRAERFLLLFLGRPQDCAAQRDELEKLAAALGLPWCRKSAARRLAHVESAEMPQPKRRDPQKG